MIQIFSFPWQLKNKQTKNKNKPGHMAAAGLVAITLPAHGPARLILLKFTVLDTAGVPSRPRTSAEQDLCWWGHPGPGIPALPSSFEIKHFKKYVKMPRFKEKSGKAKSNYFHKICNRMSWECPFLCFFLLLFDAFVLHWVSTVLALSSIPRSFIHLYCLWSSVRTIKI